MGISEALTSSSSSTSSSGSLPGCDAETMQARDPLFCARRLFSLHICGYFCSRWCRRSRKLGFGSGKKTSKKTASLAESQVYDCKKGGQLLRVGLYSTGSQAGCEGGSRGNRLSALVCHLRLGGIWNTAGCMPRAKASQPDDVKVNRVFMRGRGVGRELFCDKCVWKRVFNKNFGKL